MISKIGFFINAILLLLIWSYSISIYSSLPEIIPIHFDGEGIANGFGSKKHLWIEVLLATVFFIGFAFLYWKPHYMNFPDSVKNNTLLVRNVIQILCFIVLSIFFYMIYTTQGHKQFYINPGLIIGLLYILIMALIIYISKKS